MRSKKGQSVMDRVGGLASGIAGTMAKMTNTFGQVQLAFETGANFFSNLLHPSMGLNEIAEVYSESLNEIIREELKKGEAYGGGQFKIEMQDEENFVLSFEMYFQTKENEWVKKDACSTPQSISYLKDAALAKLQKEQCVAFEIDAPDDVVKK